MKMNFEYFQIRKWMLQTVRAVKVDEKMGSLVYCTCSFPEFWSSIPFPSLSFLQFCADFSKTSKSIEEIYIGKSKRSCYALSGNSIAYYAIILWLAVLEILEF